MTEVGELQRDTAVSFLARVCAEKTVRKPHHRRHFTCIAVSVLELAIATTEAGDGRKLHT